MAGRGPAHYIVLKLMRYLRDDEGKAGVDKGETDTRKGRLGGVEENFAKN